MVLQEVQFFSFTSSSELLPQTLKAAEICHIPEVGGMYHVYGMQLCPKVFEMAPSCGFDPVRGPRVGKQLLLHDDYAYGFLDRFQFVCGGVGQDVLDFLCQLREPLFPRPSVDPLLSDDLRYLLQVA